MNSQNDTREEELIHKVHVLACKTLGLDDEDHEDDELAKPLENAMMSLIREHTAKEMERYKGAGEAWLDQPGNKWYRTNGLKPDRYYFEIGYALAKDIQANGSQLDKGGEL